MLGDSSNALVFGVSAAVASAAAYVMLKAINQDCDEQDSINVPKSSRCSKSNRSRDLQATRKQVSQKKLMMKVGSSATATDEASTFEFYEFSPSDSQSSSGLMNKGDDPGNDDGRQSPTVILSPETKPKRKDQSVSANLPTLLQIAMNYDNDDFLSTPLLPCLHQQFSVQSTSSTPDSIESGMGADDSAFLNSSNWSWSEEVEKYAENLDSECRKASIVCGPNISESYYCDLRYSTHASPVRSLSTTTTTAFDRRRQSATTPVADEELRQVMANTPYELSAGHVRSRPHLEGKSAESPSVSSESSTDSGKGGSCSGMMGMGPCGSMSPLDEIMEEDYGAGITVPPMYEFEIPQTYVGLLIGLKGRSIKALMEQSGAHVVIRHHFKFDHMKICTLEGSRDEINRCLRMIRRRFPPSRFPELRLEPLMPPPIPSPHTPLLESKVQLSLPEGVRTESILSALVTAGHFFLQQPTHPSFPSLARLDQYMLAVYSQNMGIPELPRPIETCVICAAPVMGGWFRGQTMAVYPDCDEVLVRFCDYGGYARLPAKELRQIRSDFMTLPLQASECYLARVKPSNGDKNYSSEAMALFEKVAYGKNLEMEVVGHNSEGVPYVDVFTTEEDSKEWVQISDLLVAADLAERLETGCQSDENSPTWPSSSSLLEWGEMEKVYATTPSFGPSGPVASGKDSCPLYSHAVVAASA